MTLLELAAEYRATEMELKEHIAELEKRSEGDPLVCKDLRLMKAMLRNVRDVAVVCEHYYDPGYDIGVDRYRVYHI